MELVTESFQQLYPVGLCALLITATIKVYLLAIAPTNVGQLYGIGGGRFTVRLLLINR